MAETNYALIKNNNVINVIVFNNPTQEILDYYKELEDVDLIIPANQFTAVGGTYDGFKFWAPQPYPSWTKDEEEGSWVAPVRFPISDSENPYKRYNWNEEILNWEEIQVSE